MKAFGDIYRNKKVLVTGHTGFKGTWLTVWLKQLGAHVIGISDQIPTKPSMFEALSVEKEITHHFQDIRDLEILKSIIFKEKPDFVFHLAAQPIVSVSYKDPVSTILANAIGTTNVLEAIRLGGFKCTVVLITSDKCYDNVEWEWGYKETDVLGGKDIYSGSKAAAEIIFKSYYHSFLKHDRNIKIATARAGNVIGGGDWAIDRIVPDCMRAWNSNIPLEIRSPDATRPWQHVLEPLSGYLRLGQVLTENTEINGDSFNFGPAADVTVKVEELIKNISDFWNFKDYKEAYEITGNQKFHEAGLLKLNCDKALFYLKWKPVLSYDQLIEFTGSWYHEFYENRTDMYNHTLKQIREYSVTAKSKNILWAL